MDPRFILHRSSILDCTQYSHDYEILSSFHFDTYLNPLITSNENTYGMMDADESVYYLNIFKQSFVLRTVFCLKFLRELYV